MYSVKTSANLTKFAVSPCFMNFQDIYSVPVVDLPKIHKMSYGKLQANLSGQSSESGNLTAFTLSITSTVKRSNFQTPVLSPGATIWANVSDMVNLESVKHLKQHFMKINFLALIVILPYNTVSCADNLRQ